MRGGWLHNQALIAPLEAWFRSRGALVYREFRVRRGTCLGFIDLFATFGSLRIACEAELSPARVPVDIAKAEAVQADLLLILVPTPAVARAIRQKFLSSQRPNLRQDIAIWILPLGAALQRLGNLSRFSDTVECRNDFNPKIHA
jgi:hypothetical protein